MRQETINIGFVGRLLLCFITTVCLCVVLLVLSAKVPKQAIQENMLVSAEHLRDSELFGLATEGAEGSRIDRYADAILMNIAWHFDGTQALQSVMRSAYFFTIFHEENENLYIAVTEDQPATEQYMRYWHGSIALLRPLLTVLNLRQIYWFCGLLLAGGFIWLMTALLKRRWWVPAAGLMLGLIATGVWYVPFSLEYTWLFLLLIPLCLTAIRLGERKQRAAYPYLFLLAGILTNYLDFLTVETMTCLLPLLLLLWAEYQTKPALTGREARRMSVRLMGIFAIGYVGMWLSKWLLAALVMDENVLPFITSHVSERISGDVGVSMTVMLLAAIPRNLACLFPIGSMTLSLLLTGLMVFAVCYVGYIYHRKRFDAARLWLYAGLMAIPYVRYLLLPNHSYLHCFFTYRAQLATILGATLLLYELVDSKLLFPKKTRK